MADKADNDQDWLQWIEEQQRVVSSWMEGRRDEALRLLEDYLRTEPPHQFVSDALAYRAELKREQGDIDGAVDDFRNAHRLSRRGSYSRYTLEITLGRA